MTNIEKKISKGIREFKEGDIITRVEPAIIPHPYTCFPDQPKTTNDYTGIGTPFRFIEISENKIYLKNLGWQSDNVVELKYGLYKDGWDNYVDPKGGNIPLLNRDDGNEMIRRLNRN
jgi:hypothetical protein